LHNRVLGETPVQLLRETRAGGGLAGQSKGNGCKSYHYP
jgi:hypothetical protein